MTSSWVIRETATGRVVCETFNPKLVAALNTARYEAVPIGTYLPELNRRIADADRRTAIIAKFGCCDQAELVPCVCSYAFKCPVHGAKHVGTHD